MANVDIATTLVNYLAKNPQLITQFLSHPYSTTQQATGSTEQLSQSDMSEVVTAAAALSTGNNVDFSNLTSVAATLLSQNNGSVHALTNTLFGTTQQAQTQAQQVQAQQSSGLDLGTLVNLAGALMGSGTTTQAASTPKTGADLIDLSDGIDIKDIIGLASLLSSK